MISILRAMVACCALLFIMPIRLSADTIIKNDGQEIKGVVVEDYKDRIVFSTFEGETRIMKSDIRKMVLDDEDMNLVNLADSARAEGDYAKAADYYERAIAINPGLKAAKDGLSFIRMRLYKKSVAGKSADIEKMAMIDRSGLPSAEKPAEKKLQELNKRLLDSVGMSLTFDGALPVVERLKENMPAYDAGIKRGDSIVAIWGKLTGYLSLEDIVDAMLNKSSMEVRCTLERTVRVPLAPGKNILAPSDRIGATLDIGPDGLAIFAVEEGAQAYRAGLKKGDLVTAINGKSTRYLQFGKALAIIGEAEGDLIKLTIHRDAVIWKGGE